MKKILFAAISAGILSGCSSAPPLATPKGEFVDLNTDITSLLPHTEPVYTGTKIANISSPSLVTGDAKAVNKNLQAIGTKGVVKSEARNTSRMLVANSNNTVAQKQTAVPLKGFITPVVTVAAKPVHKQNTGDVSKTSSSVPAVGKNPFAASTQTTALASATTKPPVVVPVKVNPVLKVWEIQKGTTLVTGFIRWMDRDKCPSEDGKWKLKRQTDTDYPIDYPLSFHAASFEDAARQLFNLYRKAQAPIYVSGYRNQCLIVISDRK